MGSRQPRREHAVSAAVPDVTADAAADVPDVNAIPAIPAVAADAATDVPLRVDVDVPAAAVDDGEQPPAESPTKTEVIWRRLPGEERDVHLAALGVIETLTQHLQRTSRPDPLLAPRPATFPGAPQPPQLQQAAEPVSFTVDRNQIVRWTWDGSGESLRLFLSDGNELVLDGKTRAGQGPRSSLDGMDDAALEPQPRRRRPPRPMRRPGQGGVVRQSHDPFEQLDRYGACNYLNCVDGARICLVDVCTDDDARAAILTRNSAEEKEKRLRLQVEPCWGMAEAFGITTRTIVAATHMSGLRLVRERNSLAPPPGTPERDDMLVLFALIERGLIDTVIVRDIDRLARDELQGFRIIDFFKTYDVNLLVDELGRQVDYRRDHKLIREAFALGRDERDKTVTRTQRGLIQKGPMSGKGWLGPTKFGLLRDQETKDLYEDEEQWWIILKTFELADVGAPDGSPGGYSEPLSCREIEAYLSREYGVDLDHDFIRRLLQQPIYATGERTCRVRGVELAQDPVILKNPVPLDRYQRVQDNLKVRKGRASRTEIGEFLLNSIACVHLQCAGAESKAGSEILIKGHNVTSGRGGSWGRYRHSPSVPDGCKKGGRGYRGAHTWEKEELERPIVNAVLEIAKHPEVLRQAALAARHEFATTAQMSPEQRELLEGQYERAVEELKTSADIWINKRMDAGEDPDMAGFLVYRDSLQKRAEQLQRRLDADDVYLKEASTGSGDSVGRLSVDERLAAFREILTVETPDDPAMRRTRARLLQRIVSRVEIDDSGSGTITIYLYGHLVPDHASPQEINPLTASHDILDAYLTQKNGQTAPAEVRLQKQEQARSEIESDLSALSLKSDWNWVDIHALIELPSESEQRRAAATSLTDETWHRTRGGIPKHVREQRAPGWVLKVIADLDDQKTKEEAA
jgi:DNA invertase Pin-like site-specific DNA recombinase